MKAKIISAAMVIAFWLVSIASAQDPLRSWNNTGPKKAIVDFVVRVTKESSPKKKGWIVISMKDDWKTIFPPTNLEE
jgi:hypothetical protein